MGSKKIKEEKKDSRGRKLLKLFVNTLYLSAFTFGGGFVIVSVMKRKFVDELGWIDEPEMLDIAAMAQCAPGAIAVNAAVLVGNRVAGVVGMFVAVFGSVLPPLVLLSVISVFYHAFSDNHYVSLLLHSLQAGVAAVILDVVFSMGGKIIKDKSWIHIALMFAAFIAVFAFDVNVFLILLAGIAIGVCLALYEHRKEKKS